MEPEDAVATVFDSVGVEARSHILDELTSVWIDALPESRLKAEYDRVVEGLDNEDLSMLAAWHATLEVGVPVANREFLVKAFPRLGEGRREALKVAAMFNYDSAIKKNSQYESAVRAAVRGLSSDGVIELLESCMQIYCWDRLGTAN